MEKEGKAAVLSLWKEKAGEDGDAVAAKWALLLYPDLCARQLLRRAHKVSSDVCPRRWFRCRDDVRLLVG